MAREMLVVLFPEAIVSAMYVRIWKFVPGTVPAETTKFETVELVPQYEYVNGLVIVV